MHNFRQPITIVLGASVKSLTKNFKQIAFVFKIKVFEVPRNFFTKKVLGRRRQGNNFNLK